MRSCFGTIHSKTLPRKNRFNNSLTESSTGSEDFSPNKGWIMSSFECFVKMLSFNQLIITCIKEGLIFSSQDVNSHEDVICRMLSSQFHLLRPLMIWDPYIFRTSSPSRPSEEHYTYQIRTYWWSLA